MKEDVVTWQDKKSDFVCDFDDFDDFVILNIIIPSIAIRNTKNKWVTIDFDELWGEIVD